MAILLTGVKVRTATIRALDYGSFLTPPLGGAVQRVNRLGNRYAIDIELPPLIDEALGRTFTALLDQALTQGALFAVPQLLPTGSPGSPVVNGAVSGGTSVPIRGLTSGYTIKAGQYLSIIRAGQRYLYRCTADVTASGGGFATAVVMPTLRTALVDADVVELATPYIQGWVAAPTWTLMTEPYVSTRFTISEAA